MSDIYRYVRDTFIKLSNIEQVPPDNKGSIMNLKLYAMKNKTPTSLLLSSGQLKPPVNLSYILDRLSIARKAFSFTRLNRKFDIDVSGAIFANRCDVTLYYRRNCSLEEQRYTTAHEIGHCCLHTDEVNRKIVFFDFVTPPKFSINMRQEDEADAFAAELLVPKHLLKPAYLAMPQLSTLTESFKVPIHVMRKRLIDMGLAITDDVSPEVHARV